MNAGPEDGTSIETLIVELRRLGDAVDKDDLSGLAKMHGVCEALMRSAGADAAAGGSPLCELVHELGKTLEALILGEAADPDEAMSEMAEKVSVLEKLAVSAPSADVEKPPVAELSDDEVSARLACVFQDEPSSDNPSAMDETTTTASNESAPSTATAEGECPVTAASSGDNADAKPAAAAPPYESEPLSIKESETEFVKGFVEEAYEHIEAIEAALLEVEREPDDSAKIDSLFRPFHTIKGMAGFLNLRDINCLAHEAETLLDQGRKGKRTITPGLIDLIFDVVDILKVQVSAVGTWLSDPTSDTVPQPPVADMIGHLRDVVAGRIEPSGREAGPGSSAQKVGENLVEQGACPQEVVDFALDSQKDESPAKKTGAILVETGTVTPKQVSKAIRPQTQAKQGAPAQVGAPSVGDQSVRIDTAKLDALVDMVGELVIAQTQVSANSQIVTDPKLEKDVNQVTKIVRDVQEVAMGMRMVPIGPTFQKMARLVRDVSRKAGKQVELTISGEDTELDKNVIQQINDPLVHMVRNAVDHGIEPPEVRADVGKDNIGRVHLSAFHRGGDIVIEISDDGKGLDTAALIAKGIEKGVIRPDEELTDQQAFGLIFAPGFSMAKQVTDISGRGVGMDVVRRNIEQLRGKVEITSELGNGSTFSIRLPLTLAIIDGMVVRVGGERFIIQTISIKESLRPQPSQITTVQHKGEVLNVRGRLVPLIQLGSLFGLTERTDPCEAMVLVALCDDTEIGIVVEELIGQQQVVIKSLGERFERLRGVSGAAILGDGRVGLILEMSGLIALHDAYRVSPKRSESSDPARSAVQVPSLTIVESSSETPGEREQVLVSA